MTRQFKPEVDLWLATEQNSSQNNWTISFHPFSIQTAPYMFVFQQIRLKTVTNTNLLIFTVSSFKALSLFSGFHKPVMELNASNITVYFMAEHANLKTSPELNELKRRKLTVAAGQQRKKSTGVVLTLFRNPIIQPEYNKMTVTYPSYRPATYLWVFHQIMQYL